MTSSYEPITFAGTPPTTLPAGTSFVTTAPAATMLFSLIVTPKLMMAFAPIYTLSYLNLAILTAVVVAFVFVV